MHTTSGLVNLTAPNKWCSKQRPQALVVPVLQQLWSPRREMVSYSYQTWLHVFATIGTQSAMISFLSHHEQTLMWQCYRNQVYSCCCYKHAGLPTFSHFFVNNCQEYPRSLCNLIMAESYDCYHGCCPCQQSSPLVSGCRVFRLAMFAIPRPSSAIDLICFCVFRTCLWS